MSTHRAGPSAISLDMRAGGNYALGPNGRRLCRECKIEVPKGRFTFCSRACSDAFQIKCNPGFARRKVFYRDEGVCAICRVDTLAHHSPKRYSGSGHLWQADHITPVVEGGGVCGLDNLRTLCTACHKSETAALAKRRAEARKEKGEEATCR